MASHDSDAKPRNIGRRRDDLLVRERNERYQQLLTVGQVLTSEINMDRLFELIMDQTNRVMNTERSTVFLYDETTDELWSLAATGMKRDEIRMPSDSGIAGWVFHTRSRVINNDVYNDPRFFSDVDRSSGFQTRNLLCLPLVNRKNEAIGVLQSLNKVSGDFVESDLELLASISNYVAIAVENAKLYDSVTRYSEKLKQTLVHLETLERVKNQLTKFVPSTVSRLVEKDPDSISLEKKPRDVSVLFIDIEGFSRITESIDPRQVNEMVENHFSAYLDCIRRHGGDVNETSGDGLMVLFKDAAPKDNARSAVLAGLEIVSKNDAINRGAEGPCGRVCLHLGVNSGTAWVGCTRIQSLAGELYTYTASGLVTVVAARIGALSTENRLYIGPETYRLLGTGCDATPLGPQNLKNVSEPVSVYWVRSASPGGTPHPTAGNDSESQTGRAP